MEPQRLSFNDAKFQFLLSKEIDPRFDRNIEIADDYHVSHTSSTAVLSAEDQGKRITIVGLCIDAYGLIAREDIAAHLLDEISSLNEFLTSVTRFAGKYLIIYQSYGSTHVVGDATSSLPLYYTFEKNKVCVSSSAYLTASFIGNKLSDNAIKARRGAGLDQALPYDVTLYDNVFSLLPNYYLDLLNGQAARYFPVVGQTEQSLPLEEVVEKSVALIGNIVKEYSKYHELICPLTAGWDSRVVYAFLNRETDVKCYTFRHPRLTADAAELAVPKAICEANNNEYDVLEVKSATDEFAGDLKDIIGAFHDSGKVNLAYSYRDKYKKGALINGDIMGQIGKSSLFNAVPAWLSPNSYFVTKTHNYSAAGWKLTAAHLKDIRGVSKGGAIFDLFSWENRCGRWAAQSSEIYSACGIDMLNIFNCAELIRMWLAVPPAQRVDNKIHLGMLNAVSPELLAYPCNPDSKIDWLRRNSYVYFVASHIKYGLGGVKRLARA